MRQIKPTAIFLLALAISLLALFSSSCQQATPPQSAAELAELQENIPPAPTLIPTETSTPLPSAIPPTTTYTPTPTPTFTPTPAFPPFSGDRPVDRNLVGIQVHSFGEDQAEMIQQLADLDVGWVKIQVSWKLFQPEPDRFDEFWFAETDRFIRLANEQNIKVLVSIAKAPEWSRPTTEEDGPPADFDQFTDFTQLLATRYAGQVDAWELWNESNLRREWNGAPLNGAEFTRLVAAGAAGIRQVDSTAVLISGAPAPTGINDGINAIDDRVYFEQMLAAGIGEHVDAIGYHPYGAANPVWGQMGNTADYATSHNDHPSFFFSHTTADYLDLMGKYGVDKQLWGTEFGWGTFDQLDNQPPAGAEFMGQMGEWQQAINVIDVYIFADRNDQIGPMFVWNLNFGPLLGGGFAETGYSILRPDGSPRPTFYAVEKMPKR